MALSAILRAMTILVILILLAVGGYWYYQARSERLRQQQAMRRLYRGPIRRARRAAYRQRKSTRGGRYVSKELRAAILQRDNFTCQHCGINRQSHPDVRLELDHITPYSWGGKTTYANLQVLCRRCNQLKANKFAG
jgi:5-methylcytosine-specific restriction endonuclease McrA